MAEKTAKVRVKAPFRVVHQGDPYSDGDELLVFQNVADEMVAFTIC